jgi:uncharacterized protein YybS (DUF2232 family)
MIAALSVVLALASYYLPFLLVLYLFIPVPTIILCQRQGFVTALLASVAATLIMFLFMDLANALFSGIYLLLVGCGLGYVYYRKESGPVRLGVGTGAAFASFILMILLLQVITGQNFIDQIVSEFNTVSSQVMSTYQGMGLLSSDQLGQMQSLVDEMMKTFKMTIPLVVITMPFFIAWANIVITDAVLKRIKAPVAPLAPLSHWHLPSSFKNFLLLVILFLVIVQVSGTQAIPEIYTYTLMQLVFQVYVLMGLSFLFWLISRKKQQESMGLKVLIVLISLAIPLMSYVLSILGVTDIYMNIRLLITMKDEHKK